MKKLFLIVLTLLYLVFCLATPRESFAANYTFQDNFNDSSVSSLKWISSGPQLKNGDNTDANWTFQNNAVGMKIQNKGFQFNELVPATWDNSIKDYEMSVDFKLVSGVDSNVVFRYKDHSNWYGIHGINNENKIILQKAGGSWSSEPPVKNFTFTPGVFYTIKIDVKGENIKVYIDNNLLWDVTDVGTTLTAGKPGMQASTGAVTSGEVVFDNFTVQRLDNVLDVPYYSQNDSPWGSMEYDHASGLLSNPTIDRWGCAITSTAMVLNYHGMTNFGSEYQDKNIDPQTLNEWLKNNGGYSYGVGKDGSYSYINWNKVAQLSGRLEKNGKAPYSLEYSRLKWENGPKQDDFIKSKILNDKNPVILEVRNFQTDGHFVVATGIENNTWDINDPEWHYPTLSYFNDTYYQADYYSPSHTDLSYLVGVINPDVDLLLIDPNGKKTGRTIENNQIVTYNEIPNATYGFESPISNPNGNNQNEKLGTGVNAFYLPKPLVGNYKVLVSSKDPNSLYTLNLDFFEKTATDSAQKYTGYVGGTNQDSFDITFASESASQVIKTVNYDSTLADIEELWNTKQIKNKTVYTLLKDEIKVAQLASKKKNNKPAVRVALLLAKQTLEGSKKYITDTGYEILKDDIKSLIDAL